MKSLQERFHLLPICTSIIFLPPCSSRPSLRHLAIEVHLKTSRKGRRDKQPDDQNDAHKYTKVRAFLSNRNTLAHGSRSTNARDSLVGNLQMGLGRCLESIKVATVVRKLKSANSVTVHSPRTVFPPVGASRPELPSFHPSHRRITA